MPVNETHKYLFIMNPVAGGRAKWNWELAIRDYFRSSVHTFEMYYTTGENDRESITFWIENWKPDKIVAVGGDGTLKLAAEAQNGSKIPVCVFPAGSANGMAQEIKMPQTPRECIHVLLHGVVKPIDVIRINERNLCVHLSDIGINAQLVKYFQEDNVRGKLGYIRGAIRMLWRRRQMQVMIKKQNVTMHRTAFMVVLANASSYGTGIRINPLGRLNDGLFEVIILKQISVIEIFKMLFLNRPFNPEKTEILQAEALTIEVKRRAYFQIDGEYLGKTKQIAAKIEKDVLRLVFPNGVKP